MNRWQRKQYPDHWKQLADACKARAGYQCEQCGVKQFEVIEGRTGLPYMVYLHAAHADPKQRKDEPAPHLICLCPRCHAKYDYAVKQRQARVALERLKHQRLLARHYQASGDDPRLLGG